MPAKPCTRPANRSRRLAGAVLVTTLTLGLAAGAPAAEPLGFVPAPPQSQAQHYQRCLETAHTDPQKAYRDAETWHDLGGSFPAAHCAAVALVGMKKYAAAARALEALANTMMEAGPAMRANALDQAGQAWLLANRPGKAKTAFDSALALRPKDPGLLIDRAEALALAGKFFKAIDDLNTVLAHHPDRVDALVYRASAYRQLGNLGLALDDARRALRLDPDSVPALLERGNIRRLRGNLAGAKADWRRVVELASGSPAAAAAKENLALLAKGRSPNQQLLTGLPAPKPKP